MSWRVTTAVGVPDRRPVRRRSGCLRSRLRQNRVVPGCMDPRTAPGFGEPCWVRLVISGWTSGQTTISKTPESLRARGRDSRSSGCCCGCCRPRPPSSRSDDFSETTRRSSVRPCSCRPSRRRCSFATIHDRTWAVSAFRCAVTPPCSTRSEIVTSPRYSGFNVTLASPVPPCHCSRMPWTICRERLASSGRGDVRSLRPRESRESSGARPPRFSVARATGSTSVAEWPIEKMAARSLCTAPGVAAGSLAFTTGVCPSSRRLGRSPAEFHVSVPIVLCLPIARDGTDGIESADSSGLPAGWLAVAGLDEEVRLSSAAPSAGTLVPSGGEASCDRSAPMGLLSGVVPPVTSASASASPRFGDASSAVKIPLRIRAVRSAPGTEPSDVVDAGSLEAGGSALASVPKAAGRGESASVPKASGRGESATAPASPGSSLRQRIWTGMLANPGAHHSGTAQTSVGSRSSSWVAGGSPSDGEPSRAPSVRGVALRLSPVAWVAGANGPGTFVPVAAGRAASSASSPLAANWATSWAN
jgi:hypothetical protein